MPDFYKPVTAARSRIGLYDNFLTGGGSSDYMGVGILIRQGPSGGFWYNFDHVALVSGPAQVNGSSATPRFYAATGAMSFSNMSVNRRGIFHIPNAAGADVKFDGISREQGGIMPFFTHYNTGGVVGGSYTFRNVELDTMNHAMFANLASTSGGNAITVTISGFSGSGPANGFGFVTGAPIHLVNGIVTGGGQNNAAYDGLNYTSNFVNVTGSGEFAFQMPLPLAPASAIVSSGGSVPVGTHTYSLAAIDIDGGMTTLGPSISATTTSGNQTVTITTPATPPLGAVNYALYRDTVFLADASIDCANFLSFSGAGSGLTFVDIAPSPCGQSQPTVNTAGAQSITKQGINTTSLNIIGGGFKDSISGTFSTNRTKTDPDVSGTLGVLAGAFTATHCLQAAGSGATLSIVDSGGTCGAGGGGATFQVNSVNTTNQTTINFQNSAATNGQTYTFSNPSVGIVQLGVSGTLDNAGLTNSGVTINAAAPLGGGGTVPLGGTLNLTCTACTAPTFQTNGVNNSNQGILNFVNPATFNGLTFSFSNPGGSGNETFTLGGALGNAGLANSAITIGGTSVALGGSTASFPIPGPIGGTTPSTGAFTTLSASSTVSGAGFSTFLASPPAIGGTAPASGKFTTLTANTSLVINGGSALTTTNQSGTGSICLTTNCALITPNLGTPSALTLTNASGLPLAGLGGEVDGDIIAGVTGAWTATTALPNGVTATTQTTGDSTNKVATDAFVIANSSIPTLPVGPNGIPQTLVSQPSGGIGQPATWSVPGVPIDAQVGTSYSIPITDDVHFLTGSNGSATAWTGFALANNYVFSFENLGTGLITYTPASGTVNGNATQIIPQNWFGFHYTNNTNTFMPVMPTIQAFADCNGTGKAETFTAATGGFGCNTITASAAAGGSTTQIQYNNATALGGITNFTSNGTNPLLTAIAAPCDAFKRF